MKEFFKQCLEDLEFISGNRQLYWMKQNCESQSDFNRKKDILINSMVIVSKEFEYIPEASQKCIIQTQIIKDQNYEGLYSSTIWKWLNAYKAPYLNPAQLQDKPVIFEPQSEETKEMIRKHLANLSGLGDPVFKQEVILNDMKKIEKEDRQRIEHESLSTHYKLEPEKIVMQQLKKKYGLECTDIHTGRVLEGMPSFEEWLLL